MNYLLSLCLVLFTSGIWAQSSPTSYTIERSNSPDYSSPVITTTNSTSLSVAGLAPGTYYLRMRGSNGTAATTSAYVSTSVTIASSGTTSSATSLTFTNAEIARPMSLSAGPPRYYQGKAGEDWGAGGNTGLATTKIPAGADGWASFQFTANTMVAMGFDTLNIVQSAPAGYGGMREGMFVYNQNIGVVRNGVLIDITPTKVAAVGSTLRVRREIIGGVANYYVEYSTNGTTWSDITPAPTAPATRFFTSTWTGDLFIRAAINLDNNLVKPESSSSTPR